MVKKVIAIIPARGGSKRIPHKNRVDFFGKPLLVHTIEAALKSSIFDRVVVSTDEEELAEIARTHGADVPFLRDKYVDDQSPVSVATLHALIQSEAHFQEKYADAAQLMPNCPLRTAETITRSYKNFKKKKVEFQLSCFAYGFMNPWWAMELDVGNKSQKLFPQAFTQRSQDLPKLYCPTGAIWLATTTALKKYQTFYGPAHTFYPIPWEEAIDIDDVNDLELAKAIYLKKTHAHR